MTHPALFFFPATHSPRGPTRTRPGPLHTPAHPGHYLNARVQLTRLPPRPRASDASPTPVRRPRSPTAMAHLAVPTPSSAFPALQRPRRVSPRSPAAMPAAFPPYPTRRDLRPGLFKPPRSSAPYPHNPSCRNSAAPPRRTLLRRTGPLRLREAAALAVEGHAPSPAPPP